MSFPFVVYHNFTLSFWRFYKRTAYSGQVSNYSILYAYFSFNEREKVQAVAL